MAREDDRLGEAEQLLEALSEVHDFYFLPDKQVRCELGARPHNGAPAPVI
jgi:hypothetical protein